MIAENFGDTMKRKLVEKNGNLTTYYLQPCWGIFPVGRKIRYKTFETLANGEVKYVRYTNDGKYIAEEGKYSDGQRCTKIGLWSYRRVDQNKNLVQLDVFYDQLGKKIYEVEQLCDRDKHKNYILSERFFHDDYILTYFFNVNGRILEKEKKQRSKGNFDAVRYDEQGNVLEETSTRNLPLRFKEVSFQQVKGYQNGRLIYSVFKPKNLKDVSIKTYFNTDGSISYCDYLDQNRLLMRTNNPEKLQRFLVSHQRHSKKDDKTRRHILHELRVLPTLSQKKMWMRQLLACQGYER